MTPIMLYIINSMIGILAIALAQGPRHYSFVLTTGNQLRAARALIGMDQGTLADKAGVNVNTIRAMEKRGSATLTSGLATIRTVMEVLTSAGVEFLNHGQPGVRLK